jgi:hypothetical protein
MDATVGWKYFLGTVQSLLVLGVVALTSMTLDTSASQIRTEEQLVALTNIVNKATRDRYTGADAENRKEITNYRFQSLEGRVATLETTK